MANYQIINGVLVSCDQTETIKVPEQVKEISSDAFVKDKCHTIILNQGLEVLQKECFRYTLTHRTNVFVYNMPSTIKIIGSKALPIFYYTEYWEASWADQIILGEQIEGTDFGYTKKPFYLLPYDLEEIDTFAFERLSTTQFQVKFVKKDTNVMVYDLLDDEDFIKDLFSNEDGKYLTTEGLNYKIVYNGCDSFLYSKDGKTLYMVFNYSTNKNTKSVTILDGCEKIMNRAFINSKIEEVVFPESINEIRYRDFTNAFMGSRVKRIVITNKETTYVDKCGAIFPLRNCKCIDKEYAKQVDVVFK